jgi:hypothetical protein
MGEVRRMRGLGKVMRRKFDRGQWACIHKATVLVRRAPKETRLRTYAEKCSRVYDTSFFQRGTV